VSLVHESLIEVLNRRFVCTYYNAFRGDGHDADAAAFCAGKAVRYGAVFTPDGKLVVSFGFDRAEVARGLRQALANHPELAKPSEEERRLLERAEREPADIDVQLRAARLLGWLLDYDKAQALLDRALQGEPTAELAARIRFEKSHLALLDFERSKPAALREAFDNIESPPKEWALELALDRLSLDVQLRPDGAFFTGWQFKPGIDLQAIAAQLEKWRAESPNSTRIGQIHFYLGLARMGQDDREGADRIWREHWEKYPEDRYAILSRLHHTTYQFSPYHPTNRVRSGVITSNGKIELNPSKPAPKAPNPK
jgi:tetratricopeptide (TPR) repeat protein